MFNKKVKSLFFMALLPFLAMSTDALAQDCPSCAKNANARYAASANQYGQREIVRPVVQNFDCGDPRGCFGYQQPAPSLAPMPQAVRGRNLPQKVQVLPYVERNNERVLRPLSDREVAERMGAPSGYMVSESRKVAYKEPQYVMSSGTERQKAMGAVDAHYRDGSIFGGGPCSPSDKNGGILGGGSCGSSRSSILPSGPCKSCAKKRPALPPVQTAPAVATAPAPAPAPAPVAAPVPCVRYAQRVPAANCDLLATTITYTKLPCVGGTPCAQAMPLPVKPVCPCATSMTYTTTSPIPCPCAETKVQPLQAVAVQPMQAVPVTYAKVAPQPCPCAAKVQPAAFGTVPVKDCPCAQPKPQPVEVVVKKPTPVRDCSRFAPISMEWVDFRLQRGVGSKGYSKDYDEKRFKIFGCRTTNKSALLNEGRILEKDMNFNEIFTDMVSDCYKVVSTQQCIDENTVLPEYVLTAEITDYFMSLCKDNAWKKAKDAPKGSSEMKVVWRLMDSSKTNVMWKGESVGHGELVDGDKEDEMILIQRAFADATEKLRDLPGFEDRLLMRITPQGRERQRRYLMEMQKISGICQPPVIEDSGAISSGSGGDATWLEVKEKPVQTPAVEVEIETPTPEVVIEKPEPKVEEPEVEEEPEPEAKSAVFEADRICIVERADDASIGPDNLPMIRKSIVSITNGNNDEGVGLLISEQFVMTSADLIVKDNNKYTVKTTDGRTLEAKAFRVNPRRNTALLILNEEADYTPLALNLELPAVDRDTFLSIGTLAFEDDDKYMQNTSRINSYRYAEDGAAEIVVDSFDYGTTTGATLVDENGRVVALSHRKQPQSGDLFLPFETAMRSLGVEICDKALPEPEPEVEPEPKPEKVWRKPVSTFIDEPEAKAPEAMPVKNRK